MQYIRQFSVDVVDPDDTITEWTIIHALEKEGILALGCAWKATWTEDGYEKGKPISSD